MSRYTDRDSEVYRRPRRYRDDDDEVEVDVTRSRYPDPRRQETSVRERDRDTVISKDRTDRGPRQPDFLREDYGKSANSGQLVVREERREDDTYSRAPARRRSQESVRSRPAERVVKDEITIRERDRGPPYPSSDRGGYEEKEKIVIRERDKERSPQRRQEEEIDIKIKHSEDSRGRDGPTRPEYRERDVEQIRYRPDGRGAREVDKEEINIREERRRSPSRRREVVKEEIDIDIRERDAPPQRSPSRGALIAKEREEWILRRRSSPSPPPRDYEKEEIIIRRKERSPSPRSPSPPPQRTYQSEEVVIRRKERSVSPPRNFEKEQIIIRRKERSPSPKPQPREPSPPPPLEPIYRPPIVQEIITHHRHIDHGYERVRSPTPPPPPAPPSPPREENLEIEIRRKGVRNGKAFDEDIIFEQETTERKGRKVREVTREVSRHRSRSSSRSRENDDDVIAEAEYYNRKATSRGYAGEAYNGATKDWGLVDIPPGTERVKMDGVGGGSQEITWERYNGGRRSKFITGNRAYEAEYGNVLPAPRPLPREERIEETKITERRIVDQTSRGKTRGKLWTEVTKDLVLKEAIDEIGYEFSETDDFFYIMEYLRYEDVLRLVEITEDIRRERRERIRELQWEREEMERLPKMLLPAPPRIPPPPRSGYDERIFEREYIVDRGGRRYR